jgi:hypothetical protein
MNFTQNQTFTIIISNEFTLLVLYLLFIYLYYFFCFLLLRRLEINGLLAYNILHE